MKKLLFSVIFSIIFCSAVQYTYSAEQQSSFTKSEKIIKKYGSEIKNLCSHYLVSILLGGGVGAATGGLVKYIEKQLNFDASPMKLFLLLSSWILEIEIREDMIRAIQRDLDAHGVGHKRNLMFKTAWIASWLAYFNV